MNLYKYKTANSKVISSSSRRLQRATDSVLVPHGHQIQMLSQRQATVAYLNYGTILS